MVPPYQRRVIEERQELDARRKNLQEFIHTAVYQGLPRAERERMSRQLELMTSYSDVLAERIAAFP